MWGGSTSGSNPTPVAPYITLTNNLGGQPISVGESFIITATLTTNGNTVPSQWIESLSLIPPSESIIFTPESCPVSSSGSLSCVINVLIESTVNKESYQLTMQNIAISTTPITLESNIIPFTVVAAPIESMYVFMTTESHNGNMGGAAGINTLCQNDSNNPLKLNTNKGNWATTGKTPVFNTSVSYTYWTAGQTNGTFKPESINFTLSADWVKPLIIGTNESAWYNPTNGSSKTNPPGPASCSGWTKSGGGTGDIVAFSSLAVNKLTNAHCSTSQHIICVEQP